MLYNSILGTRFKIKLYTNKQNDKTMTELTFNINNIINATDLQQLIQMHI